MKGKSMDNDAREMLLKDTMGNEVSEVYLPMLLKILDYFPELKRRHSPPEIIITLIVAEAIPNMGGLNVGPELQAEFNVDQLGNKRAETTTYELLLNAINIADKQFDGHLTIGKFTTNWQVFGRTPESREDWNVFPSHKTLRDALRSFIVRRPDLYELGVKKNG